MARLKEKENTELLEVEKMLWEGIIIYVYVCVCMEGSGGTVGISLPWQPDLDYFLLQLLTDPGKVTYIL